MDNPFSLNPQDFYASHGQISDPAPYEKHLNDLPQALPDLVKAIQGLMLHLHWAERYGITLNRIRKDEANLRTTRNRIAAILNLNPAPLSQVRILNERTVGTCRDFALFLTAVLRHRKIPVRCRAGFGTYFTKNRFEDHWVCEYWQAEEKRWVMVDPQLDELQIQTLKIKFNPLDMPRTKFVTGPQAWDLIRTNQADPNRFGIFNLKGTDFIKGNLIRDFLALNKIEILPWDNFSLINKRFRSMTPKEKDLMDRLAKISTGEDQDFLMVRAAFTANQSQLLPNYFIP